MRIRNKMFIVIVCSLIFVITSMLLFELNGLNYPTQVVQEINQNMSTVALTVEESPNSKETTNSR